MLVRNRLKLPDTLYTKYATLYSDTNIRAKACVLYFHGGGLLYGQRTDLPALHLETLSQAGFMVAAFDYPLAPAVKLDTILGDVQASILHYLDQPGLYGGEGLPYFLWGRSAGAYLCLLAASRMDLPSAPIGIVSYYGYGFLCDNWFDTPADYYRILPQVDASCLNHLPDAPQAYGSPETHYSAYVYARQTGTWKDLIYNGRDKHFYLDYTLRAVDAFPCPLFCAHSTSDPDVPYSEFLELTSRFGARKFVVSGDIHDFDRDETNPNTRKLLEETIQFLTQCFCDWGQGKIK